VYLFALAFGGFKEAAHDAVIFQAFVAAGALDHSAHDNHWAQTAFGLIIGRRHIGMVETSEQ